MSGRGRLLALAGALVACAQPAADPVILALGPHEVRRSAFEARVAEVEGRRGLPVPEDVREALLRSFLEERVVVLAARERGLLGADAVASHEQAAVHTLLAEQGVTADSIPAAEVDAYYAAHGDEFRRPPRVLLRQIVVGTEAEAREARRKVEKDPKAFEILARTTSRTPEAERGGLMGAFAPGELPSELEKAALGLPVGGLSEVVHTTFGYHVLRVEERVEAREVSPADARADIAARLARTRTDERVRAFVAALLARAKVDHEIALVRSPPSP